MEDLVMAQALESTHNWVGWWSRQETTFASARLATFQPNVTLLTKRCPPRVFHLPIIVSSIGSVSDSKHS